jgi:hypothetical protein
MKGLNMMMKKNQGRDGTSKDNGCKKGAEAPILATF